MDDYSKIAQAISYLVEHAKQQPSLEKLAGQAGLSPTHFQRKFSNWTGVSPKSLLQHLTLEQAREMLGTEESIEQVAWASGLSGPGRLHDLCVNLEAASPGEIRSGGAGLQIGYGYAATPFGECLIADTPRGICHLAFITGEDRKTAFKELQQAWPEASFTHQPDKAGLLIKRIFRPPSTANRKPLRAYVQGTRFQLKVWHALLRIPEGGLLSYGDIATAINSPRSARAVGSAVGSNSLAYLIPCHRVIRNSGIIGDYRWGSPRKKLILSLEYARSRVDSDR